jgi:hypothetical protein
MKKVTRIEGWTHHTEPVNTKWLVVDGHISVPEAIARAGAAGFDVRDKAHIDISHQMVDLPEWSGAVADLIKGAKS